MTDSSAVKWGIISTAHINRLLIPGAHASPKVDLVGVASRDAARAAEYARKWEIPRSYGSYEDLLADPEIEAVYISLPNTLHCEWSIKAVEAGKHVLCEKPMSRHPDEVEAAFDVAERNDRILSEAFMWRHNPQAARVSALVADGAIGELRFVRSAFSYSLYDADNIRLRTDVEGGALMDVGCYCVSGSRLATGAEPESVYGAAWFGETGTDWVFAATMHFPGNVLAQFDCGTALPDRDELEILGSEEVAARRRSLACADAGDRAASRRRGRANRARAGRLLPARARERQRRDPRRGRAAPRSRRCGCAGSRPRGAAQLGENRSAGLERQGLRARRGRPSPPIRAHRCAPISHARRAARPGRRAPSQRARPDGSARSGCRRPTCRSRGCGRRRRARARRRRSRSRGG